MIRRSLQMFPRCAFPPRRLTIPTLVIVVFVLVATTSPAQQAPPEPDETWITPAADRAIDQGLAYLASRQQEDGSFGGRSGAMGGNVAIVGLGGLAFLASGSTPGRGLYAEQVSASLDYVLENTQESGFISAPGGTSRGPMYGHGFATLFLAECYGMSNRPDVRDRLTKAVNLIVSAQNAEGGWRYEPRPKDADLSVTICQVMALRAARNAGIHVPPEVIDRCVEYVKRCQNEDGGFMYMLSGGESQFERSAAGVVALYSAGIYEGPEIERGIKYLLGFVPKAGSERELHYFHYGHYYGVQAMWQRGGEAWEVWFPAIREELLRRQQENGSWNSGSSNEYATAMSCIILQTPNQYLPIFQR